ncbi:hypothetical protein VNI00_004567 [Paramarasmius palmivorus]|uniref:F-box domain-containing protein n=1 Tax=Paramarasmius palmivorus TaxID=297713 RepID=A0AAW0DIA0_9AGAR
MGKDPVIVNASSRQSRVATTSERHEGTTKIETSSPDQDSSKAPIFKLPEEILAKIFVYCSPSPLAAISNERSHLPLHSKLQWLSITTVCRYWRSVSLNHPALWSTPEFEAPHFARVMLDRSKAAPLNIVVSRLPSEDHQPKNVLTEAMEQTQRLRCLYLNLDASSTIRELLSTCVTPMPTLRSIYLTYGSSNPVHGTSTFILPKGFLGDEAPRLATLSLQNCLLSEGWDSPLLHQRITTFIWNVKGTVTIRHNQNAFFRALARMPYLEVLELGHVLPQLVTSSPVISLPRLRRLRLTSSGSACFDMLHHISFPSDNPPSIHVGCDTDNVVDYSYNEIIHLLETALHRVSSKSLRVLSISGDPTRNPGNILIGAWHAVPVDIEAPNPISTADLTVEFSWRSEHPSACFATSRRVIDAALRVFSSSIETLHLGDAFKDEHFPLMACARFCGLTLKNLVVAGSAAFQVPRTLTIKRVGTEPPYSFSHGKAGQLAFSALSTLTFTHVDFGTLNDELMDMLHDSFHERSQEAESQPIHKVKVICCGMDRSESIIDVFRDHARELELDCASDDA